jgi:hypothetical protein
MKILKKPKWALPVRAPVGLFVSARIPAAPNAFTKQKISGISNKKLN